MPKPKARPGQPTKYRPEYCEELVRHMQTGLSFEAFAGVLEVSLDTLNEWANVHPAFSVAKKEAFQRCRLFWERLGIAGSAGKIPHFNCGAWIFNMKNRFRNEWKERHEVVGEDGGAIHVTVTDYRVRGG
jgi:hypothetical protein